MQIFQVSTPQLASQPTPEFFNGVQMPVTLAMARAMPMTIIQVFAFGAIVLGIFPHRRYESFVTDHGMCGSPVPKKRVFV